METALDNMSLDNRAPRLPAAVVEIRPATRADLGVLAVLLVQEFQLYPVGHKWLIPVVSLGIQWDMQQRLSATRYVCLVAVNATQEIVGTVEVGYRAAPPWQLDQTPYAYLSNLAVRSQMRQQGIAKQLIAASERSVQRWHGQDIYLHVIAHNYAARQLYLQAGYAIHQVSHEWMTWLGASPRLFLHKRLSATAGKSEAER
ncbi:GNAT family N-acetyltransferase [filamentous cyanobacterium LEGE 11480]|uniref:GNAT family N-acetyltransferase n=1 Tax=Romeriopsis navalis LEGE 11480 TaxID=2777977 RepID=A0A928VN88_9CYAN|nr:GNAT family N-acetyltransferase [Romeriopsis navalis]MBE9031656.1 GNAT family N-acetyltransferase [Romeriopsis navalis LEGE 11480]